MGGERVVIAETVERILVDNRHIEIVEVAKQGPPGPPHKSVVEDHAGGAFEPSQADNGKAKAFLDTTEITLPGQHPRGFMFDAIRMTAGAVTFVAGAGATVRASRGRSRLADIYSRGTAQVVANADGETAEWLLSGDLEEALGSLLDFTDHDNSALIALF